MKSTTALLLLAVFGIANSYAQPEAESAAVRQVALDYIEGWYTGDAARMESALHPDLAKRLVFFDGETGQSGLNHQSAMTLVQSTRAGFGTQTPEAQRLKEITILDQYGSAASVKIVASEWIDYLHLVRWNGEWKIINVLWEPKPQ